jgi:hypothetical protein
LRFRTHFQRHRGCWVQFSCFAQRDSFSAIPWASGSIFIFCAPELILGGIEGVESSFHVLRSRTRFGRYRGCRVQFSSFALLDLFWVVSRALDPVFIFLTPGLVFGGTEGIDSNFHISRSRTRFRWYRGCQIHCTCLALPNSLELAPVSFFMFRAPRLIFGGTEGVSFSFHISRSRTNFRRYNGRRVQCSCFALPDPISTVQRASEPVFMFCASRLILGGIEGVKSSFYVLRYRWRRVPFLCFAILDSFSAVPRVPGIVFMF